MKTEDLTLDDMERFSVLTMLYRMSDKIETHHYKNSTVLQCEVLGENTTITLSDVLCKGIKDSLEEKQNGLD